MARLAERFFVELESPPMLYSLGMGGGVGQEVGYIASRHSIHCFCSMSQVQSGPTLAPFFPFDEDSLSLFRPTDHTEVLSICPFRISHPSTGRAALAFVTVRNNPFQDGRSLTGCSTRRLAIR